jgi:hypothetical protein
MRLTRFVLWGIVVALVAVLFWLRATDVKEMAGSDSGLLVRSRVNASRIDSLEARMKRLERAWEGAYDRPAK